MRGEGVGAGVHDAAAQCGLVGVDHQGVPVLAEQHDPPAGGEDPAGFGQRGVRVRQDVVHLVRPVPARLPVRERQVGGTRGAYVDVGEPGAGGGQHRRIQVHTDRACALSSQFGDRPPGAAADVDDGRARRQPQQPPGLAGLTGRQRRRPLLRGEVEDPRSARVGVGVDQRRNRQLVLGPFVSSEPLRDSWRL